MLLNKIHFTLIVWHLYLQCIFIFHILHLMFVLSDLGIPVDNQSDIVQDTVVDCRPAERGCDNLPKL